MDKEMNSQQNNRNTLSEDDLALVSGGANLTAMSANEIPHVGVLGATSSSDEGCCGIPLMSDLAGNVTSGVTGVLGSSAASLNVDNGSVYTIKL